MLDVDPPDGVVHADGNNELSRSGSATLTPKPDGSSVVAAALRLSATAVAAFTVARIVIRLGPPIGLMLMSAALAMMSAPIARLARRSLPAGVGAVVTVLSLFLATTALAVVVVRDLRTQSAALRDVLLERLASLEPGSFGGRIARASRAEDTIRSTFDQVASDVVVGDDGVVAWSRMLSTLFVAAVLAVMLQASASPSLATVMRAWRRDDRAWRRAAVVETVHLASASLSRSIATGIATGTVAVVALTVAGVPAAAILGCWVGMWIVVPSIGGGIAAAAPIAATVLAMQSDPARMAIGAGGVVAAAAAGRLAIRWKRHHEGPRVLACVAAYAVGAAMGSFSAGFVGFVGAHLCAAFLTVRRSPAWKPTGTPTNARDPRPAAPWHPSELWTLTWGGIVIVMLGTAGSALLWLAFVELAPLLTWLAFAGAIAVALGQVAGRVVDRTGVPRRAAIGIVLSVVVAVITALAMFASRRLAADGIGVDIGSTLRELDRLPAIGRWSREGGWADAAQRRIEGIPAAVARTQSVDRMLPTIGDRFVDVSWTVLLAIALLIDAPRVAQSASILVPAHRRRQVQRITHIAGQAAGTYFGGAAVVAACNAAVVMALAIGAGLGLAPALALWAFVCNFIPQVGGFLGGAPLVLFSLATGLVPAVVVGLLFIAYQLVENHVLQPLLIGRAIDLPAWVALVGTIAGAAAAGVVGAVVLTPLIHAVRACAVAAVQPDFPGRTAASGPGQAEVRTAP